MAYQGQPISLTAAILQPSVLLTAHHGSDLWAGSALAGPETILRLPPAASITSKGETHQSKQPAFVHVSADCPAKAVAHKPTQIDDLQLVDI